MECSISLGGQEGLLEDNMGTKTCRTRRMGSGEGSHGGGTSPWAGILFLRLTAEKRPHDWGIMGKRDCGQ